MRSRMLWWWYRNRDMIQGAAAVALLLAPFTIDLDAILRALFPPAP